MKPILPLSIITALTAMLLAGCNQNDATRSPAAPATNSMPNSDGTIITNPPATNSLPNLHTNLASGDI
jgi:hypothetical protein